MGNPGLLQGAAVKSSVRVLFAKDETAPRDEVLQALQKAGFNAAPVKTNALDVILDHTLDVTILGLILPILNGLRFHPVDEMPTLLIRTGEPGSLDMESDPLESDGEFVRAIRLSELIECVREFLHTGAPPPAPTKPVYKFDGLVLNFNARRVIKHGILIPTTPIEFRLLHYLMRHMDQVVTKPELLRNVWGCHHVSGDLNLVDTAIMRLRKEIEDNPRQPRYIHTVWGAGYRFGDSQRPHRAESGKTRSKVAAKIKFNA
jgi:two-component system OmpR family response regulator